MVESSVTLFLHMLAYVLPCAFVFGFGSYIVKTFVKVATGGRFTL
jgi:hypothetical protein